MVYRHERTSRQRSITTEYEAARSEWCQVCDQPIIERYRSEALLRLGCPDNWIILRVRDVALYVDDFMFDINVFPF